MRVAFLYNRSTEDPAHSAEDDLPTRSPIVAALCRLGHRVTPIACTLDLSPVRRWLQRAKPDVVFNHVESLGGSDAMMAAATLLLDAMGLPYTGSPTQALVATASKLATKQRLAQAGLPTPGWITDDFGLRIAGCGLEAASFNPQPEIRNPKYILKSVFEHASFQMDDAAVVGPAPSMEVVGLIRQREKKLVRPYFAEQFIEGREFNLALLGDKPQVLPPAEIDFSAFPAGKPRIVGHMAKCDAASFEYHHTPRRFDFPAADRPLLRRLRELAIECWRLFGLRGYARVDFRCDGDSQPWILEVNTNPCLMPEAGFAAALARAGISYDDGIQRILDDATARGATPNRRKRCHPVAVNT